MQVCKIKLVFLLLLIIIVSFGLQSKAQATPLQEFLFNSIIKNDFEGVQMAISHGAPINELLSDESGRAIPGGGLYFQKSALACAVECRGSRDITGKQVNLQIIQYLISHGADVNQRILIGYIYADCGLATPIYMATASRDKEIMDVLIKNGADVNAVIIENPDAIHPKNMYVGCNILLYYLYTGDSPVKNINIPFVNYVISLTQDYKATNCFGFNALHMLTGRWAGEPGNNSKNAFRFRN